MDFPMEIVCGCYGDIGGGLTRRVVARILILG